MSDMNSEPSTKATSGDWVQDLAGIGGAGLIVFGVHLWSLPAAFIVAGVFLLAGTWVVARKSGR